MNLVDLSSRTLGQLGDVGPFSFGMWRFTDADLNRRTELVDAALSAGMNLIDTADVYGLDWNGTGFGTVESALGEVLQNRPEFRDRMVLATKGGIVPPTPYDSSPAAITAACEASLRRLQVETIDLYQIHRPDMFVHPEALAEALSSLRDAGKIREVGVSNHTIAQTTALQTFLPFPMLTTQPQYSALDLTPIRDGTFDHCMASGMTPMAWSPLAGGRLATGEGISPELLAVLDDIAAREDTDRAGVALAFVLAHPSRPIAIVGTQSVDRLSGTAASADINLDRNDVYTIIQASEGVPLP
ncbi:MAG: aldo/keto reductase [Ilumatobacteraceae bacterium]|nr:aldo/keto reductase [Actinomycetota bacterium]